MKSPSLLPSLPSLSTLQTTPPPYPTHLTNQPDCTAKAITHRIAKIKSDGKASSTGAASTPTTPKRARATKTVSTPKTPLTAGRERSRRASVKATNYAQSDDDDSEDGVKRDADAGEGEESPSKKMKREVVEEGEFEGEDGV